MFTKPNDQVRIHRKQWTTDDTWRKIEERRNVKATIERTKTRGAKAVARQRYLALKKEVKHSCRRDKRAWAGFLADEVKRATNNGNIRFLYDVSRRLSGTKMNATIPVKDTSGQLLLTDPIDQSTRWFEHKLFQVLITP